ncbi:MAG: cobalamin B12-binding domain-containing protein [Kosmotoga sp.]|nr:MAG: cobalamin B12-binding domain-containing protein [Kosmotoga sp.]
MNTETFKEDLLSLDYYSIKHFVQDYLKERDFESFVDKILVPVLEDIGDSWENGTLSLSQVYMSGRLCEKLIEEFIKQLNTKRIIIPRMAIVVFNDQHTLGKKIIYNVLRSIGYDIKDFGNFENADDLIDRAEKENIQVLLVSVLMLNSALKIKTIREEVSQRNLNTKLIVGGAPFNFDSELWKRVGADYMGKNTKDAIDLVSKMAGELNE